MLILHEGELLHTDSSTEILEHYGVKGMKWGKRLRSAASKVASDKRVRATGRYLKDYGIEAFDAVGGNSLTLAIAKKLNVSLENAHQLKVLNGLSAGPRQQKITDALSPHLERIVGEVRKTIRYYNERLNIDGSRKLEQLLVVGGGSNVPGIGDYFTNALTMPARVASPWQRLNFGKFPEPAKQFRPRYISVAGLASIPPGEVRK
jgi:type IV pilus assembly protein PilM